MTGSFQPDEFAAVDLVPFFLECRGPFGVGNGTAIEQPRLHFRTPARPFEEFTLARDANRHRGAMSPRDSREPAADLGNGAAE